MSARWHGDLPARFSIGRLDRVASAWPSNVDKHSVEGQQPVRLCNYTDVYKNAAITQDMTFMSATASPEQIDRFRIELGDTLITKDSETADDIGVPAFVDYAAEDLVCGYHLAIIRPTDRVDARFMYWVMCSRPTLDQWAVLASGVTRVGIRSSDLNKIAIPLPPRSEQPAIADCLDRETARIDTLIEEQQRLIEMLRERRSALIRHSMTPASHWTSDRVKNVASTSLGKMLDAGRAPREADRMAPYVRAADVLADGTVNLSNLNEMPFSDGEMRQFDLRAHDVLLIEGGATVGRPGYVARDASNIAFQKTVNRVRLGSGMDPRFVYWAFALLYESNFYASYFGSVSFVHLTGEKLRELSMPHPSIDEQRRLSAHLDEQTAGIDRLMVEVERFIELSRERRAALITAAVTGQIDVRGEVA